MIAVSAATAVVARVTDAATDVVIAMVDVARVAVASVPVAPVAHVPVALVVPALVVLVAHVLADPVVHVPVALALVAHRAAHARHVQRRVGRGPRRARQQPIARIRQPPTISPHSPRSRRIQLRRLKPTNPTRSI
jgi:hypothetical protein